MKSFSLIYIIEVKFLTDIQRENDVLKEKVRKAEIAKLIAPRKAVVSAHLSKFKSLLNKAKKSSKVEILRRYVDRLKKIENPSEDLSDWIDWSEKAIDWYDHLIEYDHPYLRDVDKDTLTVNRIDGQIENWYLEYSFKDYEYDNDWENYEGILEDE